MTQAIDLPFYDASKVHGVQPEVSFTATIGQLWQLGNALWHFILLLRLLSNRCTLHTHVLSTKSAFLRGDL